MKDDKLEAIVCVAGGWAGGNAASSGEDQYKFEHNGTDSVQIS